MPSRERDGKKEAEATKETAISRYGWTMEAKAYMHFCKATSLYYSALEFAMALEKNETKVIKARKPRKPAKTVRAIADAEKQNARCK